MPSFDIVSKTEFADVDNALQSIKKEIETRYDFKGAKCSVERKDAVLTVLADDDLKLKQMHELLQGHLARRKIEPGVLDYGDVQKAAGQSVRQVVTLKNGIDKELAKTIVKGVKDSKLKVQISIQGEELRVVGKNRDDLQTAIAHVKSMKIEQPLQYVNFRD
ncbi:MAG: YajQ family cyclic di-GMP-binding protein [Hyphomicrobiales bacterium]|nr:YajQ family cyclic di-GMP-binding protein [Hyphomicrobiales bacterium]